MLFSTLVYLNNPIKTRAVIFKALRVLHDMDDETANDTKNHSELLQLASSIVSSYLRNNQVPPSDIPPMIRDIHATLHALTEEANEPPAEKPKPAVPIKKSITHDHLICLEDGKKLTMLKRYLRTHYDMSPEEYRERWGLPADYPMVAPGYSERRSELAISNGLGRSGGSGGKKPKK